MIKVLNERMALEARTAQAPIVKSLPVRVFIATTDRCNISCPMCPTGKGKRGEMPFGKFKVLAEQLFPSAKEYHATVDGEPLATSYFLDIVPLLERHNTTMNLTTNGLLLDVQAATRIMGVLSSVKFSFNGAEKETFERLSRGSDFKTVLENIERFMSIRENSNNSPKVTLQSTLSIDNISELPDIVRLGQKLGVDRVKAYFMIACKRSMVKKTLWFFQDVANRYLFEAEHVAKELGLLTRFPRGFSKQEGPAKPKTCHFAWEEAWIGVNGIAISCCHPNRLVMGDTSQTEYAVLWNNGNYQTLRKNLNTASEPSACKTCLLVEEFNPTGRPYTKEDFIHVR